MSPNLTALSSSLNKLTVEIAASHPANVLGLLRSERDRVIAAIVESDDPTYFAVLADAGISIADTAQALVRHAASQYQLGFSEARRAGRVSAAAAQRRSA